MISSQRKCFTVLWVLAISGIACEQFLQASDRSNSSTMASTISRTPLASAKNAELIYQADVDGISGVAYAEYTKIWLLQRRDANANLWRGFAAQRYWVSTHGPNTSVHLSAEELHNIYRTAEDCLRFAREKAPNSSLANLYYGNFLFWYGSNETKGAHMIDGMSFMKKASMLAPHDAQVHTLLGAAYSEKSGNAYNLDLAERELRLAEHGNPTNSYIPWRLTSVYISLGQYTSAQRELDRCQKLVPKKLASRYYFPYYQGEIAKHVRAKAK